MIFMPDDRRHFGRFIVNLKGTLHRKSSPEEKSVILRDVSAFGIGVQTQGEGGLGDDVEVYITLHSGVSPMKLNGKIVWHHQSAPNFWNVGIRFDRPQILKTDQLIQASRDR